MQSTGWTALFFCCRDGNLELVKLLLQRHGNTTIKDHVRVMSAVNIEGACARKNYQLEDSLS